MQVLNPGRTGKIRTPSYVASVQLDDPMDVAWLTGLRTAIQLENKQRREYHELSIARMIPLGYTPAKLRTKRVRLRHRCKDESQHKYAGKYQRTIKREDALHTDVYVEEVIHWYR